MPNVPCPTCGRNLSIPDELVGRQVRCAECQGVFVAETGAAPRGEAPGPEPDDRPRRRRFEDEDEDRSRRRRYEDDDDYDDEDEDRWRRRRRRRDALPHRGNAVLTLGIIAIASMSFCGPFLMLPLGIVAWVMGAQDLRQMREGNLDPSGEGVTRAGKICGMIAVILSIVCGVYFAVLIAAGAFK